MSFSDRRVDGDEGTGMISVELDSVVTSMRHQWHCERHPVTHCSSALELATPTSGALEEFAPKAGASLPVELRVYDAKDIFCTRL